jgi:hypothetical protein
MWEPTSTTPKPDILREAKDPHRKVRFVAPATTLRSMQKRTEPQSRTSFTSATNAIP